MEDQESLLDFPCMYPLKIMGKNTEEFQEAVYSILERHIPETTEVLYSRRPSSGEKYLSITATFTAESQEQLTAIYAELNESHLVLVTL